MKLSPILALLLLGTELQAASKPCEELKAEIAAKLEARGVQEYQLEITNPGGAVGWTVVGSCEGGTREILYRRGRAEWPETLPQENAPLPLDGQPEGGPSSLPEPSSSSATPAVACGTKTCSSPSPPHERANSSHLRVMSCTLSVLPVFTSNV